MLNIITKILEALGLKGQNKSVPEKKGDASKRNSPDGKARNPHANGGCCGSCGGQKQGDK